MIQKRTYKAPPVRRKRRQAGARRQSRPKPPRCGTRHIRRQAGASSVIVRFALVRHSLTQANVERRYISYTDSPLLPEAGEVLRPMRRAVAHPAPLLYTSDMRRCRETLAQLRPRDAGRAHVDTRLREYDFGMWEGLTYNDLKEDPSYRRWLDDMTSVQPPRGEPWQTFSTRTAHVWWEILQKAGRQTAVAAAQGARGHRHRREREPDRDGPDPGSVRGRPSCLGRKRPGRVGNAYEARPDVLVVTHGGMVRRLYTLAFPKKTFWDAAVPIGAGILITAAKSPRRWKFLRAERLP